VRPPQDKSVDPREVERKFHFPFGSRAALEARPELSAAANHHEMMTCFGTPDSLLDGAKYTMRVRRSDKSHIQMVKFRSDGSIIQQLSLLAAPR
jgi:inorganic triphosphatase YgiF